MNYVVYHPEEYRDLPLLVYLHGAGERGKNVEHLTRHGVARLLAEGREYNAIVLTPQCPAEYVWDNVVKELKAIIDKVVDEYEVKPDRICITGSSMGGFGTWMMGLTYPNFFSAIGPVAGGGMSWRAAKLVSTPVYALHGDQDGVVPERCSLLMVEALKSLGYTVRYQSLKGFDHNDGIYEAYANTDLVEWLLAQRRTDFNRVAEICEDIF